MMILGEINKTEKVTILMVTHDVLSLLMPTELYPSKLEAKHGDCWGMGESFYDVIGQKAFRLKSVI